MKILITENRLDELIRKKIMMDLSGAEVIMEDDGDLWIINREREYWYAQWSKGDNELWWRFNFFENYSYFFSKQVQEIRNILVEIVLDIFGLKMTSVHSSFMNRHRMVHQALMNGKTIKTL